MGVAAGLTLVIPGFMARDHAGNERAASSALKELASAEADFRANDRDGNRVTDFWTGDVAGLHGFGLIPREIAEADAAPLEKLVPEPRPYRGYLFVALARDDSETPPVPLKQDTDKSGLKVRHTAKFGFCAYPAAYGRTGKPTFIINEGNTIFRKDIQGKPFAAWPSDETWASTFSRPLD